MLDDFGGGDRAKLERSLEPEPARLAGEEAGGEQVARAGRVDQPLDRLGRHVGPLAARNGGRACLAAGHDQRRRDLSARQAMASSTSLTMRHRRGLGLIGEQDVDLAVAQQLPEAVAVAVDAECVGQGEGDLAAGGMGRLDRGLHRRARLGRIPQIAFEVDDAAVGDRGRGRPSPSPAAARRQGTCSSSAGRPA